MNFTAKKLESRLGFETLAVSTKPTALLLETTDYVHYGVANLDLLTYKYTPAKHNHSIYLWRPTRNCIFSSKYEIFFPVFSLDLVSKVIWRFYSLKPDGTFWPTLHHYTSLPDNMHCFSTCIVDQ